MILAVHTCITAILIRWIELASLVFHTRRCGIRRVRELCVLKSSSASWLHFQRQTDCGGGAAPVTARSFSKPSSASVRSAVFRARPSCGERARGKGGRTHDSTVAQSVLACHSTAWQPAARHRAPGAAEVLASPCLS